MGKFLKMDDGSFAWVGLGEKPPCPAGFVENPDNPIHCIPPIIECEYREPYVNQQGACCGQFFNFTCKAVNRQIIRKRCLECKGDVTVIKEYVKKHYRKTR